MESGVLSDGLIYNGSSDKSRVTVIAFATIFFIQRICKEKKTSQ